MTTTQRSPQTLRTLPIAQATSEAAVCCAPVAGTPITAEEAAQLAGPLKAIAEPTRLRLLSLGRQRRARKRACAT